MIQYTAHEYRTSLQLRQAIQNKLFTVFNNVDVSYNILLDVFYMLTPALQDYIHILYFHPNNQKKP